MGHLKTTLNWRVSYDLASHFQCLISPLISDQSCKWEFSARVIIICQHHFIQSIPGAVAIPNTFVLPIIKPPPQWNRLKDDDEISVAKPSFFTTELIFDGGVEWWWFTFVWTNLSSFNLGCIQPLHINCQNHVRNVQVKRWKEYICTYMHIYIYHIYAYIHISYIHISYIWLFIYHIYVQCICIYTH